MMKARLAGLILLMGASMAAQAHTRTFALDDEDQGASVAMRPAATGDRQAFAGHEQGQVIKAHLVRDPDGDFDGCPGPIPEPGTYAMLLAGLGLMTTIARRKRMDR